MSIENNKQFASSTDTFTHGGNLRELAQRAGCSPEHIIDFSANINPLGPHESLRMIISRTIEKLVHYPDPQGMELKTEIACKLDVDECQVTVANGSTEIIYALPRAVNCKRAVIPVPSYTDYEKASRLAGLRIKLFPLREEKGFQIDFPRLSRNLQDGDIVFLGRPNNPTGVSFPQADLLELVASHPNTCFAVDESFYEFVDGTSGLIADDMSSNLVVFRSLTKFYGIPGLRLGFAVSSPNTAKMIQHNILPWTVNTIAQEVGKAVVADSEFAEKSRIYVRKRREELQEKLSANPSLKIFRGEANYLLVRVDKQGVTAGQLADRLLASPQYPIAIRNCENFSGLDNRYFRVAVRTEKENDLLCRLLASELGYQKSPAAGPQKKARCIMLQGTSSNAGKSVLTAALCRIFLQDGYRVAPFKAQNMSLNSYVTRDGGEMGRAQVVQAQACRLDPDVRMNPVLLKPSSDVGSQVIVNGRVVDNMSVKEYINFKAQAWDEACAAYDSLAGEYDVIVLEGAGSPAEVNLKSHDIVNMAMARYSEAPVLLVGDIDRGGVFASFIGSLEVMAEWERKLVAGFLVNCFRGKASLLDDAYRYVYDFTGKPVLGTIPYINDHGLPEEDSVSFKAGLYKRNRPDTTHVSLGVIDLPHISNFTDFEPFLGEPDVYLQIIRTEKELMEILPELSALILPGSKNVISDMKYLKDSGLARQIYHAAIAGKKQIVGICGGFQMLGRKILDPYHIESDGEALEGLSVLEMTTTLAEEKTLVRQAAVHLPSSHRVHGYEIHHGRTVSSCANVLRLENGLADGAVSADNRIWGTYLHGIFDDDLFRRWFIDELRSANDMDRIEKVVAPYDLEPAFERLAEIVRQSVDIEKVYSIMGLR